MRSMENSDRRLSRCTNPRRELVPVALALTGDLLRQERMTPAAILGGKGGSATVRRGSDYFGA